MNKYDMEKLDEERKLIIQNILLKRLMVTIYIAMFLFLIFCDSVILDIFVLGVSFFSMIVISNITGDNRRILNQK